MTDIRAALRAAVHGQPAIRGSAASTPITVPKLNNNDVSYLLLSWLVPDGRQVIAGEPVAEIDTSKAVQELAASADGVLRQAVPEGAECRPGDHIGMVTAAAGSEASQTTSGGAAPHAPGAPLAAAAPAARPAPGPEGTAVPSPRAGLLELTRNQQLVAGVVTAARREIPDAFAVRRARLDAAADLERALDEQGAAPVGLLELIVKIVGDLRASFPLCFARLADPRRVALADAAHVGVTLDAGNGLFIPVVRAVEHRLVAEIADELADFRLRALRANFTPERLTGANIAISWNHYQELVLVQPVILPGLACVVSVGGPLREVRLDGSGLPVGGTAVHIGLAHDHRIVNGREAVAFLDAVATAIEDPVQLGKLASG